MKAFSGETLGYVTPWNSRGYDFAKLFRHKFTYISPVWLQIREDGKENTPMVTGTHDIDPQWIQAVRGADGRGPKVVPRVVYERNKLASTDVPLIITQLLDLAEKNAFDGIVFEIPVVEGTMDLLLRMGEAFQEAKKLLLLVLIRSTKGVRDCFSLFLCHGDAFLCLHGFTFAVQNRASYRSPTTCLTNSCRLCTASP